MKKLISMIFIFFSLNLFATEGSICLENAKTQYDMNNCKEITLSKVKNELNRVLEQIEKIYFSDEEFLDVLKKSQLLWKKSKDANLQMRFPLEDKYISYGRVFPMCSNSIETKLIIQRIEYLKQWLSGIEEGDVCGGSIKSQYQINKYNKSVK